MLGWGPNAPWECECASGYEYGDIATDTCLVECESHLLRNSADDVCECADPTHSVLDLTSGKVCAPDCGANE
jgi:hypothetical protein